MLNFCFFVEGEGFVVYGGLFFLVWVGGLKFF